MIQFERLSIDQKPEFDALLRRADDMGADYIATGHYARIRSQNGRYLLLKAADEAKDQSYFLYQLTQ